MERFLPFAILVLIAFCFKDLLPYKGSMYLLRFSSIIGTARRRRSKTMAHTTGGFLLFWLLFHGLCLSPTLISGKAIYRGVATNAWAGGCNDITALSRMSWYYNWGHQPTSTVVNCDLGSRYLEFVPMLWGAASVTADLVSRLPSGFSTLLGFNEPNFVEQSNIYPAEAAQLWKNITSQLQEAGILNDIALGSPSASPGGDLPGYSNPNTWLEDFFGNCSGCKVDFICLHVYDCNGNYYNDAGLNYWVSEASEFKLPIWLTEFDCPSSNVTDELTWMHSVLPSLDSNPNVTRYAWFTARPTNVGTAPTLLYPNSSLTQVGSYYNSAGDMLTPGSTGSGSASSLEIPSIFMLLYMFLGPSGN